MYHPTGMDITDLVCPACRVRIAFVMTLDEWTIEDVYNIISPECFANVAQYMRNMSAINWWGYPN